MQLMPLTLPPALHCEDGELPMRETGSSWWKAACPTRKTWIWYWTEWIRRYADPELRCQDIGRIFLRSCVEGHAGEAVEAKKQPPCDSHGFLTGCNQLKFCFLFSVRDEVQRTRFYVRVHRNNVTGDRVIFRYENACGWVGENLLRVILYNT